MAKRAGKSAMITASMEAMVGQIIASLGGDPKFPNLPGNATALGRAQDLMWEAFDTSDAKQRLAMAKQALAISPLCADAHVLLAQEEAGPGAPRIAAYRAGVAAGAKALGKRAFKEDVGHFWGILETRPYMRALHGLAAELWRAGQYDESLEQYTEMLRLNPNDNQGVRYETLDHLLELGRDAGAATLVKAYKDDGSAGWAYGRALLRFRKSGAGAMARKALDAAVQCNRHVPAFLTGAKPLPRRPPEFHSPGDANEAITYAYTGKVAWAAAAGAVDWLRSEAATVATASKAKARQQEA